MSVDPTAERNFPHLVHPVPFADRGVGPERWHAADESSPKGCVPQSHHNFGQTLDWIQERLLSEHESCVHEQTRELRLEAVALRAELQRVNGRFAEASQDFEVTAESSESEQHEAEAKSSCIVEHAFSPKMSEAVRVSAEVATNRQASCKSDDVSVVSSGLRQKFSNSWFSRHWSFSSLGSGVPFGGRPSNNAFTTRRSSSSEWERFQMEHILLQSPHRRQQPHSRTIEETISLAEKSWKQGHRTRSDELIFNMLFDNHTQDLAIDSFGGIVVVINTLTIGLS
eukprot:CAMPEP_0194491352 /NCGR_PEP_ID=MMETSP0253-20130528/10267_1 /TAXON_ID=2966 /ORGANISM="Noctiluca scintillans" /LENGTH=282 /DNA_ID=CAMNT_0039332079 /DNA_START=1 /DNA_END=846 /DNA_ORIENTATION=-